MPISTSAATACLSASLGRQQASVAGVVDGEFPAARCPAQRFGDGTVTYKLSRLGRLHYE